MPGGLGPRGEPGERGERGLEGPPGMLPIAKAYAPDTVHYAGEVVVYAGATFQATKDTGQAPPHRDWICLAIGGVDGLTPRVRGVWKADGDYLELDIVALNGGTYIAKCNDPGPCPGEGWQSLVQKGRPGNPGDPGPQGPRGEPGARGERGERGVDAPVIMKWQIDRKAYRAIPIMSDGKPGPTLELRGLFEAFAIEAR